MASKKSAAASKVDQPQVKNPRRKTGTSGKHQQPSEGFEATDPDVFAQSAPPSPMQKADSTPKPVRRSKRQAVSVRPPELADMTSLVRAAEVPEPPSQGGTNSAEPVAAELAGQMSSPQGLRVFQAYQEAWQRDLLDPNFAALDQSRQPTELPELTLPQGLLTHASTQQVQYWGVVSWRLAQQTGLTGQDLREAIEQHPNADVYVANPAVGDEGLYHNAWLQGETEHPGMLALAKALFKACGLPADDLTSVHSQLQHGSATVMVANHAFWSGYVKFIQTFVSQSKKLDAAQRAQLMVRFQDDSALLGSSNMLGAIIRRLLPVFLKTEGKGFTLHKLALPVKERALNVHEQLLREMKNVAHNTQSTWLIACWVNYRNLYLHQSRGKAWCQKHLREITPVDIRFG
jgi:hypothetical protein